MKTFLCRRWVIRWVLASGLFALVTAAICIRFDQSSSHEVGRILLFVAALPGIAATFLVLAAVVSGAGFSDQRGRQPYWNMDSFPAERRLDLVNAHLDDSRMTTRWAVTAWLLALPALATGAGLVVLPG